MPSPSLSNAALVAATRDGDAAAWKILVERHEHLIRAVCRAHRLSCADADDVTQATWLRALEHLHRLREPDRIAAWLATIARRECLPVLRHGARVRPCEDEALHARPDLTAAAPDARLLDAERRAAVRRAVTTLPERDRVLLGLLYSEEEPSYAEIGRIMRMPIGSIGPTRGRMLERLRSREPVAQLAAAA
jgi:RNA polymerase sigma factor (sigma-70 family)